LHFFKKINHFFSTYVNKRSHLWAHKYAISFFVIYI
jgi:hypothetical protein